MARTMELMGPHWLARFLSVEAQHSRRIKRPTACVQLQAFPRWAAVPSHIVGEEGFAADYTETPENLVVRMTSIHPE